MTNLCPELATKAELVALEYQIDQKLNYKIPIADEPVIVNQAIAGSSSLLALALLPVQAAIFGNKTKAKEIASNVGKVSQNIGRVSSKVNINTNAVKGANAAILNNALATQKANYEALYAASKASAAKNVGFSALKTATKAFNLVTGIASILGTFATIGMMAKMQQEIINLKNEISLNRQIIEQNRIRTIENAKVNKLSCLITHCIWAAI